MSVIPFLDGAVITMIDGAGIAPWMLAGDGSGAGIRMARRRGS